MPAMSIDPSLVAVLAGIGMVLAFWRQIRALAIQLLSVFFVTTTITDSPVARAVRYFVMKELGPSRMRRRAYSSVNLFVRPRRVVESVVYERLAGRQLLWFRGCPFILRVEGEDRGTLLLTHPRAFFKLDSFLTTALASWNVVLRSSNQRRFAVHHLVGRAGSMTNPSQEKSAARASGSTTALLHEVRLLQWQIEDLGAETSLAPALSTLVLSDESQAAIDEARFWLENRNWYTKRHIPWRRGWILTGKPGSGKTSLARAIAEDLDIPVFSFDLASLTNEEARSGWAQMMKYTPCMALMEDIDTVFAGRRNITNRRDGLSFDTLLNCIDGMERASGVFLVVTTNNPKDVDPALSGSAPDGNAAIATRPGRIDRVFNLGAPTRPALVSLARRILPDHVSAWDGLAEAAVESGDTFAQFQERCMRIALGHKWAQAEKSTQLQSISRNHQ